MLADLQLGSRVTYGKLLNQHGEVVGIILDNSEAPLFIRWDDGYYGMSPLEDLIVHAKEVN